MTEGLAQQMVYGDGKGQSTKHFYAGAPKPINKRKKCKKKLKSS